MKNLGSTWVPNAMYQIQSHRSIGSGKEDFLKMILTYMGTAAILVM